MFLRRVTEVVLAPVFGGLCPARPTTKLFLCACHGGLVEPSHKTTERFPQIFTPDLQGNQLLSGIASPIALRSL